MTNKEKLLKKLETITNFIKDNMKDDDDILFTSSYGGALYNIGDILPSDPPELNEFNFKDLEERNYYESNDNIGSYLESEGFIHEYEEENYEYICDIIRDYKETTDDKKLYVVDVADFLY